MRINKNRWIAGGRKVAALALATGFVGGMPARVLGETAPAPTAVVTAVDPAMFEGFWQIEADPDATAERGGRLNFEEYFIMESGVVTAQELSRLGFTPATATFGTDIDGSPTFTATLTSGSQGTVVVEGKLMGGRLTGSITWTRPDGNTYKYAYAGATFSPGESPS